MIISNVFVKSFVNITLSRLSRERYFREIKICTRIRNNGSLGGWWLHAFILLKQKRYSSLKKILQEAKQKLFWMHLFSHLIMVSISLLIHSFFLLLLSCKMENKNIKWMNEWKERLNVARIRWRERTNSVNEFQEEKRGRKLVRMKVHPILSLFPFFMIFLTLPYRQCIHHTRAHSFHIKSFFVSVEEYSIILSEAYPRRNEVMCMYSHNKNENIKNAWSKRGGMYNADVNATNDEA